MKNEEIIALFIGILVGVMITLICVIVAILCEEKPKTAFERRGKWVHDIGEDWDIISCSVCGGQPLLDYNTDDFESDYCPWCGARMSKKKEGVQ